MKSKKSKQDTSANVKSNFGAKLLKITTKSSLLSVTHNTSELQSIDTLNESSNRGFGKISELLVNQLKLSAATRADSKQQFQDMLRQMKEDKLESGLKVVPEKDDKKDKEEVGGLSGLLAAIAVAIGVGVGLIWGQFKAIKTVGSTIIKAFKSLVKGFGSLVKRFTPNVIKDKVAKIFKGIKSIGTSISKVFKGLISKLDFSEIAKKLKTARNNLARIPEILKGFGSSLKSAFTIKPNARIMKAVTYIKSALSNLTKPFTDAWKVVKSLKAGGGLGGGIFGKMGKVFKTIKGVMGSFGGIIAKVAPMMSKLFAPVAIIMGIVDAVKGAMAGFEKDGILGGVVGAITGLLDGLISKPLDLLKDMISWIAEKLGFENFSKLLDSFSFSDLTGDLYNILVGLPDTLMEMAKSLIRPLVGMLGVFAPDSLVEWVGEKPEKPEEPKEPPVTKTSRKKRKADKAKMENPVTPEGKPLYTVKPYKAKKKSDIPDTVTEEKTYKKGEEWKEFYKAPSGKMAGKSRYVNSAIRRAKSKAMSAKKAAKKAKMSKSDIPDTVTEGTKSNQNAKQASDNAKANTSIVDASNVQTDNSSYQTINNLAPESPRTHVNRF